MKMKKKVIMIMLAVTIISMESLGSLVSNTSNTNDDAQITTAQGDIIAELKEKYITMINLSKKTMNEKRTQINYEMMKDNTDWEYVEKLSKEMKELEKEVSARTEEYKREIEKFNPSMSANSSTFTN